jgi:carbonic anhydrase
VPPYHEGQAIGTVAAINFAVKELKVENIIVLGHSYNDVIQLLMNDARTAELEQQNDPMALWLRMLAEAKSAVRTQLHKKSPEEQEAACEQESILISLRNLISYPAIEERINADNIGIFGWHFELESGILRSFNPETKQFESLD